MLRYVADASGDARARAFFLQLLSSDNRKPHVYAFCEPPEGDANVPSFARPLLGRVNIPLLGGAGGDYEFVVEAEPPLVYLDHWAVRRLSERAVYGNRFLTAFKRRGTVMFSLMNVTEIARDASLQRAAEIRAFLDSVKSHWVPMTIDGAASRRSPEPLVEGVG